MPPALLVEVQSALLTLCHLSIFAAGHAIGVTEQAGEGGATWDARHLADQVDGLVGGAE